MSPGFLERLSALGRSPGTGLGAPRHGRRGASGLPTTPGSGGVAAAPKLASGSSVAGPEESIESAERRIFGRS